MVSTFGLLDLTVEDLLVQGQRAKLETFDGYNVLIMHVSFDPATREVSTPEVKISCSANFLVTGHDPTLRRVVHDPQGPVITRLQLMKSPTLLVYGIVDRLVDAYYPVLDTIDDAIEEVEERVLSSPTSEVLGHIFTLKPR